MQELNSFKNQLLIAMPNLVDPSFFHGVTFVCQHNSDGALGLVINHPMEMTLGDVLEQMDMVPVDDKIAAIPIFSGGPVQQERGFVLHHTSDQLWESSIAVSDTLSLTTSRDILKAIADDKGPDKFLITLGYAGWSVDQLETEMKSNTWLSTQYDEGVVFDTPISQRWSAAANKMGLDINLLTSQAGHA
ncbi:MAG TPA: YqgE/AlgH family protein [Methyloprofundus sp.]|uniref:YqgE/AlgH family protein n=1 Tax=Methyloprofundus sp. TaxID=2020875 RepID=UPI00179360A6|nr:YqgE/AlgH family protein [Methyloprofundus sp.]HIG64425.1 YqgE/AlgH family protein [Methyloprofundus sp.]HIL79226.1 YqgE/AlgH family protein [Methylococcales bacterium]